MKSLEALRALGTGPEAPSEAKERVAASLAVALGGGLAGASLLGKAASAPSIAAAAPLGGIAGSKVTLIAVAAWLAGGITGAAIYRGFRPQEVRVVYAEAPRTAAEPVPSAVPAPAVANSVSTNDSAGAQRESPPHTPHISNTANSASTGTASALTRERALLDEARAAAAHGDASDALALTEKHRAQFPQGRLREEREALAIRALLSLGRVDEGHARAAAFRRTYPLSLLLPALDAALAQ